MGRKHCCGFGYCPQLYKDLIQMGINRGLTEPEAIFIKNRISNAYRVTNDPCNNNFRFAVNDIGLDEYFKAKDNGCCGYYDEKVELRSGKIVRFGFNYGH